MPDLAWIDGDVMPLTEARVSYLDHGYFYGYGVYEACKAFAGKIYALAEHMARLNKSLRALEIRPELSGAALRRCMEELVAYSGYAEAFLYLQITRGVGWRGPGRPAGPPFTTMFVTELESMSAEEWDAGVAALTLPDERWAHPDIKSLNLLPNILAKEKALAAGAQEAIFYNDRDWVTEAASSNVFAVSAGGEIVTPPLDGHILAGVSRLLVLRRARADKIRIKETILKRAELARAAEIFITGTGAEIIPVTRLDGAQIGAGRAGTWTRRLYDSFLQAKKAFIA
ncbi:MAG: aminotransferase class IV [Gracilibacteraceae bacterium]|jgi:D-alanine transaminase|nr:aminotransferase class IV [Gracilibacteraceae bacterium]